MYHWCSCNINAIWNSSFLFSDGILNILKHDKKIYHVTMKIITGDDAAEFIFAPD